MRQVDIALAAGARYQLAKIILVHKERLMKFMKHSARVPSSNKLWKEVCENRRGFNDLQHRTS